MSPCPPDPHPSPARPTPPILSSPAHLRTPTSFQIEVADCDIVVGDLLCFNAHNLATIPADGLLVDGVGVKMDESALTGEPEPISKSVIADLFILSGTTASAGAGKMLVIAVGEHSTSGKIHSAVYGKDAEAADSGSPLQLKLDKMVVLIGRVGLSIAGTCLIALLAMGLGDRIDGGSTCVIQYIMEAVIVAITILAVAVPEGLPLAVTLSLAISSQRMSKEQNLVKTLDSCETMGSATTICSDKTGTLTANRMTVRGVYILGLEIQPDNTSTDTVGSRVAASLSAGSARHVADLIGIATMDESFILPAEVAGGQLQFKGNPTECALLVLCQDMGFDYGEIRRSTRGRSAETKAEGRMFMFSSARKVARAASSPRSCHLPSSPCRLPSAIRHPPICHLPPVPAATATAAAAVYRLPSAHLPPTTCPCRYRYRYRCPCPCHLPPAAAARCP